MMRSDLFTLLSLSHKTKFVDHEETSRALRRGCLLLLEKEMHKLDVKHTNKDSKILEKLEGWHHVLHERCTNSELDEARKINYQPVLSEGGLEEAESTGIFMFAATVKPGLQQFVIYDPKSERAFCREIVIDLNNKFIECPELPVCIENDNLNQTQNVWIPWKADTHD